MTKAEAGRLGGLVRGGQKAIAARANARKGRDLQRTRDGALFGKVLPVELRPGYVKPPTNWERFHAYRQAEDWQGIL